MASQSFDAALTQAADKLVAAIETYGPKATELALAVGQVDATRTIVEGFVCLAVSIGIVILVPRTCFRWVAKGAELERQSNGGDEEIKYYLGAFFLGAAGALTLLVTTIAAIVDLTNVFAWVGLSRPDIYLAAKLLKL